MRLLALVLVALGLSAAPAQAGSRLDRAQRIAATVWNNPCDGQVRVVWEDKPGGAANVAYAKDCMVSFDAHTRLSWGAFCTFMIHEYGHLANYRDPLNIKDPTHSHNPRSVMYRKPVIITDGHHPWELARPDRRCL
jgi:hypothetical protein